MVLGFLWAQAGPPRTPWERVREGLLPAGGLPVVEQARSPYTALRAVHPVGCIACLGWCLWVEKTASPRGMFASSYQFRSVCV